MPPTSEIISLLELIESALRGSIIAIVVLVFLIMLVAIFITWKIAGWKTLVDSNQTFLSNSLKTLEENLTKFMEEMREDVKKIFHALPQDTTKMSSPITLTDLGKQIAEEIKAKEVVEDRAETFISRASDMPPYEIQEMCFKYAEDELINDPNIREEYQFPLDVRVKTSAYKHGLEVSQVLKVIGVLLRDKVLEAKGFDLPD